MDSREIQKERYMGYDRLVKYLLKKYGPAQYDYFLNETCRSKNHKVTRTGEGLLCHHIDEDKGISLSSTSFAQCFPFEYQKANRLVYCNYLEHLALHIQIWAMRGLYTEQIERETTKKDLYVAPGVVYVCRDINELYQKGEANEGWRRRCYDEIKDNYDDYIFILQSIFKLINSMYTGNKQGYEVGGYWKTSGRDKGIIKAVKCDGVNVEAAVEFKNRVETLNELNYKEVTERVKTLITGDYNGKVVEKINNALR